MRTLKRTEARNLVTAQACAGGIEFSTWFRLSTRAAEPVVDGADDALTLGLCHHEWPVSTRGPSGPHFRSLPLEFLSRFLDATTASGAEFSTLAP